MADITQVQSLDERVQLVCTLMDDHAVEAGSGIVARLPLAPEWLLAGMFALVFYQLVVGHQ